MPDGRMQETISTCGPARTTHGETVSIISASRRVHTYTCRHNVPIDTLSTRSHRSYGSMSETGSPGGVNLSIPHLQHHSTSPPLPQTSGAMSIGSIIEHNMHNEYRTHSVPPNLHDHLSSQPIGTAPRSLRPEMLYGLSPSGDSLYSSSDSCYSPLSDYLQAPQPLPQQYYAPDLVQRPQSAIETCYQSMEASPLSVGPPTAVQSWNNYDPAALGFAPETQCIPPVSVPDPVCRSAP